MQVLSQTLVVALRDSSLIHPWNFYFYKGFQVILMSIKACEQKYTASLLTGGFGAGGGDAAVAGRQG